MQLVTGSFWHKQTSFKTWKKLQPAKGRPTLHSIPSFIAQKGKAAQVIHATELSVDSPGLVGQVIIVVDAPSGHVPIQNVFKVLRLNLKF